MEFEAFDDITLGRGKNTVGEEYQTIFVEASAGPIEAVSAPEILYDFSNTAWSPWGTDNFLPKTIRDDIQNCGVLSAALDAKARIATGKGLQPFLLKNITSDGKEELEWVDDTEIHDWLERNETFDFSYDSAFDTHAYGWSLGSYLLDRGKKTIRGVKRHDVYEARLEKKDKATRIIKNIYLSSDWATAGTEFDKSKQVMIELLEQSNELEDLQARLDGGSNSLEFAFCNRSLRNGSHYYPIPAYRSGAAWIKIARSVPAFKNAMFKNQITLKYLIIIHPKFWEDRFGENEWKKYTVDVKKKHRDDYYDMIDKWLVGEDNAYKSFLTGGFYDKVADKFTPYLTITPIDDKLKDGQLLPDSGAANSEILFALMINPALMGAGNPGGKAYGDTSGGSNVRESYLTQIMLMEAERRTNASVMNVVKQFNGWSERLEKEYTFMPTAGAGAPTPQSRQIKPRLVFRHLTGLLTTLDTGKSTKTETA